jgi:predicted RNase H-like nuclease
LPLIVGIDGCKSGWFAAWQNQEGVIETAIFQSISNLKNFFIGTNQLIIGIDIPVILSEVMPRQADQLARKLLSKKASSVFTAPTPEMLDFPNTNDGLRGMAFIDNVVASGASDQKWTPYTI